MKNPNIKVILDTKIELPNISDAITDIINNEIQKDLQEISNQLADKIGYLLEKYEKLKIYQESA